MTPLNPHQRNKGSIIRQGEAAAKSNNDKSPLFCLRHLQDPYCVTSCERDDKAAFAVMLKRLSSLTWQEITQAHRKGLGFEKIARSAIKAAVPAGITEDVNFIAFRFNGQKPMVGFRDGEVFHIVWLDRDMKLYNHG